MQWEYYSAIATNTYRQSSNRAASFGNLQHFSFQDFPGLFQAIVPLYRILYTQIKTVINPLGENYFSFPNL